MFGFNLWAVIGICVALLGAGSYVGWKTDAHFKAIELAQAHGETDKANALAAGEKAQCVAQIAEANVQAANDLADANARLAASEDALARQKSTAETLNARLQKALSDESNASKLSASVLNYLSLLRSSYDIPVDAESATNIGAQAHNPGVLP